MVTSDIHGRLAEDPERGWLGAAKLLGLITRLRREADRVHLADCGDMFSGHAFGSFDNGRTAARILGRLGFEAICLGNHDFDFGPEEGDPLHHLRTLVPILTKSAGFSPKVLGLGMSRKDGSPIEGVQGAARLGPAPGGGDLVAIGVPNPHTARGSLRECLEDLDFGLEADAELTRNRVLGNLAKAAEGFGQDDLVVVLSHLGHSGGAKGSVTGRELAKVPNISVVVDGHGHLAVEPEILALKPLGAAGAVNHDCGQGFEAAGRDARPNRGEGFEAACGDVDSNREKGLEPAGGAVYLNCGEGLEAVAIITLSQSAPPEAKLWRYGQLAGEKADPDIKAMVSELGAKMRLGEEVAELPAAFGGYGGGGSLPAAGHLVCHALLAASKADMVFLNEGAVRGGLSAGVATIGDVLECLPFRDHLYEFAMDGSEIESMVAWLIKGGGHLLKAGVSIAPHEGQEGGLGGVTVLDGLGKPLIPLKPYKVAASSQMLRRTGPFNKLGSPGCRKLGLVENYFVDGLRLLSREAIEKIAMGKQAKGRP